MATHKPILKPGLLSLNDNVYIVPPRKFPVEPDLHVQLLKYAGYVLGWGLLACIVGLVD